MKGNMVISSHELKVPNLVAMMPRKDLPSRVRTAMYTFSYTYNLTAIMTLEGSQNREQARQLILQSAYHDLSKSDMNTALMWMVTHFLNSTRPAAKKVLVVASSAQSTDDDASPEGLFNPKLGLQRLGESF
ncbi:hypothetical protein EB796_019713 [Bugula neritina]|uniref:VWFA domain-containing protein n=1 Tax=Bugula neritina TaxID=10212 RepID=A0A7J7J8L2_BUGNE|nr:hypothetical protein EB796_019713 [Bugula neritina]